MNASEFPKFLVDQTPKFDEMILDEIRPEDNWCLSVATGTCAPDWWICREKVRKIAEGQAFVESATPPIPPMGTPLEMSLVRFSQVWKRT